MRNIIIMAALWAISHGVCAAADRQTTPPQLRSLDVTVGKWTYQGESFAVGNQKAERWTWFEDCAWSPNHAFVTCNFTMKYADKIVKSEAVNTFNVDDQSYWHYEMFDSDGSGADPFISKMTIADNVWTTSGKAGDTSYRVTYRFDSSGHVTVRVESTKDNVTWLLLGQGEGTRQP